MKTVLAIVTLAFLGLTSTHLFAEDQKGEVKEIIIKIQTPDGPRWYSLGTDLSKIDVKKGAIVRFNYNDDDQIEGIEVETVEPEGGAKAAE